LAPVLTSKLCNTVNPVPSVLSANMVPASLSPP
jgi:hypothetical protein